MTIERHTLVDGQPEAIYAETANINYFLNTGLTPDSVDGVVNVNQSVKQHSRRAYVGSSLTTVTAHARTVIYDPGRRNGSATPGQQMILDDGIERRQFSYVGSWTKVHAFLVGDAKVDMKAFSAGARYNINAVSEGLAA